MKLAVGVNTTWPPEMATTPPVALPTAVTVRVCVASAAGPAVSLAVSVLNAMVRAPLSSATSDSVSATAVGATFTPTIEPGEPTSEAAWVTVKAPLVPLALSVVSVTAPAVAPFRAAALSKVLNGVLAEDRPNATLAFSTPAALYRLTASPAVLRPTPEPL